MTLDYLFHAPVALTIFIITIITSIIGFNRESFLDKHILLPYDMILYKEYWRVITSGFIHGNTFHLVLNMVTYYFFAFMLEHRLGHWEFAVLYISGLMISNIATTLWYKNDTAFDGSLGASGAISAIVLSAVICNPYLKFGLPVLSEMFPILQLPGYVIAAAYLIYSLVNSLRKTELPINHVAHLWGAIAGIIMTFTLKPAVVDVLGKFIDSM